MSAQALVEHGITKNAVALVQAATEAGVPLWIAAAMIEKESGGANVYGNDRGGVYAVGDPDRPNPNVVTPANYTRFEQRVLAGETSNGVGPAQITHPDFIRDARARGIDLADPAQNIRYGLDLLARYLGGLSSPEAITSAGLRYNGALTYGLDLTARALVWLTRLDQGIDMARRRPTISDLRNKEAELRARGFDIYCGPSFYAAGHCRPGKHGHSSDSRHFVAPGLALDVGKDPKSGAAMSDYERAHLDLLCLEFAADTKVNWRIRWRDTAAQGGAHHDHLHVDDRPDWFQSRNLSGVLSRDGVSIFIDPVAFPHHIPPTNRDGGFTLTQGITAQRALASITDPSTGHPFYTGGLDGYLGNGARTATRGVQKLLGVKQDGNPGAGTQAAIRRYLTSPPKPPPVVKPPVVKPEPKPEPQAPTPGRLGGTDRYDTAAMIARQAPPAMRRKVYLAASDTPDAVTAAAAGDGVVLLARKGGSTLPGATAEALGDLRPTQLVIVGDTSVIPESQAATAYAIAIK